MARRPKCGQKLPQHSSAIVPFATQSKWEQGAKNCSQTVAIELQQEQESTEVKWEPLLCVASASHARVHSMTFGLGERGALPIWRT